MKYFVILIHPNKKGVYFALNENDALMVFESREAAGEAAQRTLFGSHGLYEVYEL